VKQRQPALSRLSRLVKKKKNKKQKKKKKKTKGKTKFSPSAHLPLLLHLLSHRHRRRQTQTPAQSKIVFFTFLFASNFKPLQQIVLSPLPHHPRNHLSRSFDSCRLIPTQKKGKD
jgi:hypothetical protein